MSLGIILLGIAFIVLSVLITLGILYLVSGDWLWDKGKADGSSRNWSPPR